MVEKIVVIGGGQAAASFCAKLRALGSNAQVTILSDEKYYPYQRPPLSKKYLLGEMELERLLLRPQLWYEENAIEVRTGVRVESIDRSHKKVSLSDGETVTYDTLFLATGSRPRKLPSQLTNDAQNIYAVRSIDDVDLMESEFKAGQNLVVIGGGYIGLEAAAVARKFDVNVTLVEAAPRILGRVACSETADFIRDLHRENNVEIIEGIGIQEFEIIANKIQAVVLVDGRRLAADFIIAGIGIETNSELADECGLEVEQGIRVDENGRTTDANIYAAGDCARFLFKGENIRLESVQNAIDQAENVALSVFGTPEPYVPKPWFWSDQFDLSLQIAGLNLGYTDVVVRKSTDEATQSNWYYKDDQLIAVDAMNEPRSYMIAKRVIESGRNIPKEVAADVTADLKAFLR